MIVSSYLGQCTIKGIFVSVHITTIRIVHTYVCIRTPIGLTKYVVFGKRGYHVINDYAMYVCMHAQ